jgi:hypothetical protein
MNVKDRNAGEILIILVTLTVCVSIILAGTGLFILSIIQPERDTNKALVAVLNIINTLIGVVAGYLAGSTSKEKSTHDPPS